MQYPTTRILVGVDPLQPVSRLASLLRRLRIPDAEAIYASVEPTPKFVPPGFGETSEDRLMFAIDEDRAGRAILEARKQLEDIVRTHRVVLERGEPSEALDRLAVAHGASLVAIGSRDRSPLASAIFGSVGRGLALHSQASVLVAKGDEAFHGPVRAVLAFDGTETSHACVHRLLNLRPAGLSRVDVLVVRDSHEAVDAIDSLAEMAVHSLVEHGIPADYIKRSGPFPQVMRETMTEAGAELAILGAGLHGTVERIFLGSHALEQVVAEHHSVLILR